jgi:hypothetical protein
MSDFVQISGGLNVAPIRVFPARTPWTPSDEMAFVGYPPLPEFQPGTPDTPVMVSVVFKWLRKRGEELARAWADYYRHVSIGGPAYDGGAGGDFVPGMFLKKGCTITSRGCTKECEWCCERFNPLRELPIKPGWIVQDSNLLACSEKHIRAVFNMLRAQKRCIFFNGGLDKHFLKNWHRPLFDSIKIGELWFACDKTSDLLWLERAAKILDGIPPRKRRCYTMIGGGCQENDQESVSDAERRCERVLELGFIPFCQLFQPDDGVKVYSEEWRKVRRKWSRPAAMPMNRLNSGNPNYTPYQVEDRNETDG